MHCRFQSARFYQVRDRPAGEWPVIED